MNISTAIQHKNLYQENLDPLFDGIVFLIMYVMLNRHLNRILADRKRNPSARENFDRSLFVSK